MQIEIHNKEIGLRLKAARLTAGYKSRKKFCDKFSIPISSCAKYELGILGLSITSAVKFCEILDISLEWLITGKEKI